eukprot:CAMPEP_0114626902 /NCGR_PEP_ID=MMETSP0168-20121206/12021_1 /TAXON_ID=95228 ORGANISM="Vannella sp., Strain DIVA3 517/6/12" /NCGR_SAMPLE_ID=MMETSP0168 /ASSEMBLY_ACC=CAM_ASM_000044 /LENGTH=75 /DNA_ID=CAMNT_0001838221 /DNA_START=147 /DNA_END=374 /DNA_ORIENTATION=+
MKTYVRTLTGKTVELDVETNAPVEAVKAKLLQQVGLPFTVGQIRLILCGKQMEDGRTMADYTLRDKVIDLVLRLN